MIRHLNEIFEYDSNLLKVTDRTIDWTCKNCFFFKTRITGRKFEYSRCTLGRQGLRISGFCRSSQARNVRKFIKI